MKTNLKKTERKIGARVWELDALRGVLILGVLINHLQMCIRTFCTQVYTALDVQSITAADPLKILFIWDEAQQCWELPLIAQFFRTVTYPGVDCFFVVSGIACGFSRSNLSRGVKMLLGAFFFSGVTKILTIYSGNPDYFVRFGVLHCFAYCHLIYYFLLEKRSNKVLMLVTAFSFLVGYYLRWNPTGSSLVILYPFGVHENGQSSWDYWPIFPMLGWMVLGVLLGRKFYREKKSLFPDHAAKRVTRPLQTMGKYSGILYLCHVVVYPVIFYGIGTIFHLR